MMDTKKNIFKLIFSNFAVKVCFLFSFIFILATIISYSRQISATPAVITANLKETPNPLFSENLYPAWNSFRIVVEYHSKKRTSGHVPIKIVIMNDDSIELSKVFIPISSIARNISRWDNSNSIHYVNYGNFNINSPGKYQIKMTLLSSIEEYDSFLAIITKNNSNRIWKFFLFLSIFLFIIATYIGRDIKITLTAST